MDKQDKWIRLQVTVNSGFNFILPANPAWKISQLQDQIVTIYNQISASEHSSSKAVKAKSLKRNGFYVASSLRVGNVFNDCDDLSCHIVLKTQKQQQDEQTRKEKSKPAQKKEKQQKEQKPQPNPPAPEKKKPQQQQKQEKKQKKPISSEQLKSMMSLIIHDKNGTNKDQNKSSDTKKIVIENPSDDELQTKQKGKQQSEKFKKKGAILIRHSDSD